MNLPLLSEIRRRFRLFDYEVIRNAPCPFRKEKAKYSTAPINRGGGHGYFDSKEKLYEYLLELENISKDMNANG